MLKIRRLLSVAIKRSGAYFVVIPPTVIENIGLQKKTICINEWDLVSLVVISFGLGCLCVKLRDLR